MKQYIKTAALYLLLDLVISYLFYRSVWAFLILLPGMALFDREVERERAFRGKRQLTGQFLSALQMVTVSLQAGYAPENAFPDALGELRNMYPPDAQIIRGFEKIKNGLALNRPLEELLEEFGAESGVEDIESFAEVFANAKRTGGDMTGIVRRTVTALQRREEILKEMEAVLAGKRLEQRMMGVIPIFILVYVSLTSPEFMDVMYHNITGIIVMSICLVIYAAAYIWSVHIMQITV